MEPDKNKQQELAELIADPEMVSLQHSAVLNDLLLEYPYYQALHLLLAKAGQGSGAPAELTKASLYTNGQTLHRFLFERRNPVVNKETAAVVSIEDTLTDAGPSAIAEEIPLVTDEQEIFEEISEPITVVQSETEPETTEEEPVFEEIAEVDFSMYRPFKNSATTDSALPAESTEDLVVSAENTKDSEEKYSLEGDFVFESIVSSDFFAFEDKFSTVENVEQETVHAVIDPPYIEEHDEAAAAEIENHSVSNYHDDNLPYTFLWWLAKTRKEHQSTFQPYAMPKRGGGQELQQQYVEHIFHIQSHLNGAEELPDDTNEPKTLSRDFQIIDSFIKNDPQIHPPNAEQIDNENKAKKSAEDQNDLVSETLANIYIEQMLYDKAIDTYEKLSLKFPEKSRYFADLIQSLEKKI